MSLSDEQIVKVRRAINAAMAEGMRVDAVQVPAPKLTLFGIPVELVDGLPEPELRLSPVRWIHDSEMVDD